MGKLLSKEHETVDETLAEGKHNGMSLSTKRKSWSTSGYISLQSKSSEYGDYALDLLCYPSDSRSGLKTEDEEKILHNFRFLKGELDADILCDYFLRDNYFDNNDVDEVNSEKTRLKQVDLLLRKLLRLRPDAYLKFLEYLDDAGYNHVRKVLEESVFTQALNHEDITETETKSKLSRFRNEICDQLQPDVTADIFVEYGEFTVDEYEEVLAEKTRRRKSEQILRLLMSNKHIKRGYMVLIQALRETNGLFLLRLLKEDDRSANEETPISRQVVKVKVCEVKKRESKNKTKLLKESKQFQLTLNIHSGEDLEVEITKQIQECDVMCSINDKLVLHEECSITKVEKGSIIIVLKGCSPSSLRRLFAKDVQRPLSKMLSHIFSHPDIVKILPAKGLKFELTLSCMQSKHIEHKTDVDIFKSNLEFLVEELDALSFLKILKEKLVLSEEDVKEILEATPLSRKTRTRAMLLKILDNEAVPEFKDILKEKKKYVWEHMFLSEEDTKSFDLSAYPVATSYGALVENMNPKLLEEYSLEIKANCLWKREDQAKYVLQQVLASDFRDQLQFISLLSLYEQLPPQILSQTTNELKNKENAGSRKRPVAIKENEKEKEPDTDIVFAGDVVITTEQKRKEKGKRGMFSSLRRSLSRRAGKHSRRDRRDRDSAYFSLPSNSSTLTMNTIHTVKPGSSANRQSAIMKGLNG